MFLGLELLFADLLLLLPKSYTAPFCLLQDSFRALNLV